MQCHIDVDAESGLLHAVAGTAAHVSEVPQAHALVHGEEADVFADAGCPGVDRREDTQGIRAHWHVAQRPGLRRLLDGADPNDAITEQMEQVKARIRAKVEHPLRMIKRQFGHLKVRYHGLAKNTAQPHTLLALSNLGMARRQVMAAQGCVRLQTAKAACGGLQTPSAGSIAAHQSFTAADRSHRWP